MLAIRSRSKIYLESLASTGRNDAWEGELSRRRTQICLQDRLSQRTAIRHNKVAVRVLKRNRDLQVVGLGVTSALGDLVSHFADFRSLGYTGQRL